MLFGRGSSVPALESFISTITSPSATIAFADCACFKAAPSVENIEPVGPLPAADT